MFIMDTFIGILIGLFVLMALVVAHEFGHYLAAVRNGVRVLEFGIGFPPRGKAWLLNPKWTKWKKSGKKGEKPKKWLPLPKKDWGKPQDTLIFSLNYLPIGGFCQMDGESDSDERPGTFGSVSLWSKTKILLAGVTANWLLSIVIFTILAITGMPHFLTGQFSIDSDTKMAAGVVVVKDVEESSPADEAGLESGDRIVAVDGEALPDATTLIEYNTAHADQDVIYKIDRATTHVVECDQAPCDPIEETETFEKTVHLNPTGAAYQLGVTLSQEGQALYRSTWSAPLVGIGTTAQLTVETFKGLGQLLVNVCSGAVQQLSTDSSTREEGRAALEAAGDSVSGPVGIVGVLFPNMASTGVTNIAFLAGLISLSLACMNVLPIPALDGGRLFLIALYRLRGKKLEKATEEKIVSRAFIVLLLLIVLITVLDIMKFF